MSGIWEKGEEVQQLLRVPDGVDFDEHIVATYYIEAITSDIVAYTQGIALEQSTGTWVRALKETRELRKEHSGKVVGIYNVPSAPTTYIIQIAFPVENIEPNMGQLLSTVAGNITWWGVGAHDTALKLINLRFPKSSWIKEFQGPKFGIEGLRKYLNIPERPILNNMIKPCTGHTTDVHVELFEGAAYGGVDNIKDDELLADPPFNPFFDRLAKCMEVVDRKYEETGEKTIYTINATDRIDKLLEKAEKAVQSGANALMVNSSIGLGGLRMLAEDPSVKVPILYHPCYAGVVTASERSGISHPVYSKLSRMAGADIGILPDYMGKFPVTKDLCLLSLAAYQSPLLHIKPSIVLFGGGVHPGLVPTMMENYGRNIIIGAGGAIHGHPMGSKAGGKAFRQAIDATMKGIPLDEAAKQYKELGVAIEKWGYPKTIEESIKIFDLRGGKRV